MKNITTQLQTITPDMAKDCLAKNDTENRSRNKARVAAMARDMREGRWRTTHQGIAFDEHGTLIDGQHRLAAIIAAGCSVDLLVSVIPGASVKDPIDQGAGRTAAYTTGVHSRIIAACRVLHGLEGGTTYNRRVTVSEITDVYNRHTDVLSWEGIKGLTAGVIAAVCYAYPLDQHKIADFARQVIDGEHLKKGDPAYTLRAWTARNNRARPIESAFAALSAIRALLSDESIASLFGNADSAYRELTGRRRRLRIEYTPSVGALP
jgi:hypothetical protein